MNIILLGSPGAGKGTQAKLICEELSIPQISTGDILRQSIQSGSVLGKKLAKIMNTGGLVSDDIIIDIIKQRVQHEDCSKGFLFDGFPRNISQANAIDEKSIQIDLVLDIQVDIEEAVSRISGRRVHTASGRSYHTNHCPPKIQDRDDITGEPLIQREDDKEHAVRKRLTVYQEQTIQLSDFYCNNTKISYHIIDGMREIDQIWQHILGILKG